MSDHPALADDPDTAFSLSPEGIRCAQVMAASTMDHFVTMVDMARLDTTIAATSLVIELFAALQVHDDATPEALLARFRDQITERVQQIKEGGCSDCGAGHTRH